MKPSIFVTRTLPVVYTCRMPKNLPNLDYFSLETLLKTADIVTLHTPLTPETHHLIGELQFRMMKNSAYPIAIANSEVLTNL